LKGFPYPERVFEKKADTDAYCTATFVTVQHACDEAVRYTNDYVASLGT